MKTVNTIRSLFVVALLSIITITASAQRTAPFAGGVKLQQAGGVNPSFGLTMKAKPTYSADFQMSVAQPTANGILHISNFAAGLADVTTSLITGSDIAPGAMNTFLTTDATGAVVGFTGLNTNATLTGNGIGTALGINLANANTWTATQTFPTTAAQSDAFVNSINGGGTSTVNIIHGGTNSAATPTAGGVSYGKEQRMLSLLPAQRE